jgi:hypothetical protein
MLGISGPLLALFTSYLEHRTQQVKIDSTVSNIVRLASGVPQGSVLGPILFVLYINDMGDMFDDSVKSKYFADDAKLYSEIKSSADLENFQENLDRLSNWAESWQLNISINKCCVIDISVRNNLKSNYCNTVDTVEIDTVREIRDLGVIVDSKLTFASHIAKIVSTAKQRAALLFRAFVTREIKFLIIAYKSYILPILDYCSPIWSPHYVHDILQLESVQRAYTKRIPGLQNMPYNARLKALNLISLELRRLHCDLIFCYKLLTGLVGGSPADYGLTLSNRKSRGNALKLTINISRIDARKHFFASRVCDPWNALPDDLILVNSVKCFKRQLFNFDFNKYLIFKSDN